MKLSSIQQLLDNEFNISSNDEDLVEFAVTEKNKKYINSDFLNGTTGLFTKTTEEIQSVSTTVFLTDVVLRNVVDNTLLFTHHHFNYYEDERGLQPLTEETMITLKKKGMMSYFIIITELQQHCSDILMNKLLMFLQIM